MGLSSVAMMAELKDGIAVAEMVEKTAVCSVDSWVSSMVATMASSKVEQTAALSDAQMAGY